MLWMVIIIFIKNISIGSIVLLSYLLFAAVHSICYIWNTWSHITLKLVDLKIHGVCNHYHDFVLPQCMRFKI